MSPRFQARIPLRRSNTVLAVFQPATAMLAEDRLHNQAALTNSLAFGMAILPDTVQGAPIPQDGRRS